MPPIQQWQVNVFTKTLQELLSVLPTPYLTHLQFQTICNQMKIVFSSGHEQTRLAVYFRQHRTIPKLDIFKLVEPVECKIVHCQVIT